jgi:peptide chain release factor subunit 1
LINKLLVTEFSTATNIKNKKNRLAVQDAIKSIQFKLKNICGKLPKNSLVIYSGTVENKLITIDIIPIVPILSKKYLCSNRFLTEPLQDSLNLFDEMFAFILISGNATKVFSLKGNHIKKIYDYNVDLTNKTRRGGSSAGRISGSIEENHTNYLKIINENIYRLLIKENKLSVKGIILSGPGELKNKYLDLISCDKLIKNGIFR